jgi:hypothetical protein
MRVCFLVGSADISGGSYVIFQHAAYMKAVGHEVVVAVQNQFDSDTLAWHPSAGTFLVVPFATALTETFDLVIATWWKTALELHRFRAERYGYFVQSIESRFYSESEQPLRRLVDSTYALPVAFVTEARWIRDHLWTHHGKAAALVRNGIRKDLFTPDGSSAAPPLGGGRLRVLVEGPFGVWFKNTGRTLNIARRAQPGELWLLTASDVGRMPGIDRVFSRVPITMAPEVYRACDVIVKLSYVEGMFGPPLEMFHCGGTAIVYDVSGYDEYIEHNHNALVASRGREADVVGLLQQLKKDADLLAQLKAGARQTALAWPSWDASSAKFVQWAMTVVQGAGGSQRSQVEAMNATAWNTYLREEQVWLRRRPWIRIRHRIDAALDRIPRGLAKGLRRARYVAECYR